MKTCTVNRCKPWTILYRHPVRSCTVMCTLQWPRTHKWWAALVPATGAHIAGGCAGTVPGWLLPHGSWGHVTWPSHHQHNYTGQVCFSSDL